MELYLLRHGQTTRPGTYSGRTEVPLSDSGRRQIEELSPLFSGIDFDHCYLSPLQRCRETFRLLGLKVRTSVDEQLAEIDFGRWEGLSFEQVRLGYPDLLEDWQRAGEKFCFPDGESIGGFQQRVVTWFDKVLTNGHNRVLVVSHAGVLRVGLCRLLGLDATHGFRFAVDEGAVTKVQISGTFGQLEFLNLSGRRGGEWVISS